MELRKIQANLKNYQKVKNIEIKYSWIIDDNYRNSCDWCGDQRLYESNYRLTKADKFFTKNLLLCEDCRVSFYRSKKALERKITNLGGEIK